MHEVAFGGFHSSVFDGWEGVSLDGANNNRELSGTW